ncbi:MAG: Carbohydrate binding domain [Phycisphaerales bacterium]|nr:Carbohydrate binding domain [Phycisphaerales bacterium]
MKIPTITLALLVTVGFAFAADKPNLGKPSNKADSWRFEQHEAAKGTMKIDGDAAVFETTNTDGEDWHVQAVMTGLDLKEGKEYVITFKAKGEPARTVRIGGNIDLDDWHAIGLSEEVELTKEWKDFSFPFKAENVAADKKNRIGFTLGGEKGVVMVKDFKITEK